MLVELFFFFPFKGQKCMSLYVFSCAFLHSIMLKREKGKGERETGNEMKCCYMLPTGPRMSRL